MDENEHFQTMIFPELKEKLKAFNFVFQNSEGAEVIWGFDGKSTSYPCDNYVRNMADGIPQISLKLRKTLGGITLIINSMPFKEQYHLDMSLLKEEEVIGHVARYLKMWDIAQTPQQ